MSLFILLIMSNCLIWTAAVKTCVPKYSYEGSCGTEVHCTDDESDCTLFCNGSSSCINLKYYCIATNNKCIIICDGSQSCDAFKLNATTDTTISCNSGSACKDALFIITGDRTDANVNITCNGVFSCLNMHSIFQGLSSNNKANVLCKDNSPNAYSCDSTEIDCKFDTAECRVRCEHNVETACSSSGYNKLNCFTNGIGTTCTNSNASSGYFDYGFTFKPTVSPTTPTLNPTLNPTHDPTIEPSFVPSNTPTFLPSVDNKNDIITFWSVLCFILVIILGICFYRKCKNIFKPKSESIIFDRYIRNALVVTIGIGDYEHDDTYMDEMMVDADITDGYLRDLPVQKDIQNLKEALEEMLNYKLIPNKLKLRWNEQELISFLKEDVIKELFDEDNELKYDAILVCISCHGVKDYIITSDYRMIEKTVMHRIISLTNTKTRSIPRIFIFDSCNGRSQKERLRESTVELQGFEQSLLINDTENDEDSITDTDIDKALTYKMIEKENQWTHLTESPDYQLVTIHAASAGFQAKLDNRFGSYLLYTFTQKIKSNIERKENKSLGVIFEEIQKELHDKGKQHTINTFNDNTRNLHLEINKLKRKNV